MSRYSFSYQEDILWHTTAASAICAEDHDLTQRQLAALLHMPQPQYNRYEQGLRDLPTTTLIALADIYHTSTDYLLGRTNDPKPPVSL